MNTPSLITADILRFPQPRSQAPTSSARLGLFDLNASVPGQPRAEVLLGENILLPPRTPGGGGRYGCCVYLATRCGSRALPVIGCREWSRPPLPAAHDDHPMWADLRIGLEEAAQCLDTARFDLNGAVVAARAWLKSLQPAIMARQGSAILMGGGQPVFFPGKPKDTPPTLAALAPEPLVREVFDTANPVAPVLRLAA